MKSTRPGLFEYHLDAAARYLVNGSRLEGYRSIVGAGTANIWNAHYFRNNSKLKSGDLVLMDFAQDYHYYTSDITRLWPVNGKFSPVQRELPGFVPEYRDAVISKVGPGVTVAKIREEASVAMDPVFRRWKFSKPPDEKASHVLSASPCMMTGFRRPLQPGHVFSIDPQLRVPDENLYIRHEEVLVVSATGCENFTGFLASKIDCPVRSRRAPAPNRPDPQGQSGHPGPLVSPAPIEPCVLRVPQLRPASQRTLTGCPPASLLRCAASMKAIVSSVSAFETGATPVSKNFTICFSSST
jgi:hypothetical protein